MSLLAIKESDWRTTVIEYAELRGWRVYHVTDVRKRLRSHTSVGFAGSCIGAKAWKRLPFPGRIVFAELKSESGETTEDQDVWKIACSRLLMQKSTTKWFAGVLPTGSRSRGACWNRSSRREAADGGTNVMKSNHTSS